MKRIILPIILICCTLSLAAQETIRVNYKGAKPTISDFATAYLADYEWTEESDDVLDEARNAMKQVWLDHLKGKKLSKDKKLTVDQNLQRKRVLKRHLQPGTVRRTHLLPLRQRHEENDLVRRSRIRRYLRHRRRSPCLLRLTAHWQGHHLHRMD